jgi:3-oxoacyl-[acyl-carrier-protein] synthase-3
MMRAKSISLDGVRIRSTGSYVPSRVVTNQEIVESGVSTSAEWIFDTLGISERRIAEVDEYTSDLAAQAGLRAINNAGLTKNDIEMIIVATSTPDRKCPSTACIVQAKMGITNRCPAFDVSAVCSGFVYGLTIAGQFIQCGSYERILVIGADVFSKITDWNHRSCVFFGDGAGAVVVERSENSNGQNLFAGLLYADGAGMDHFTVYPQDQTFTMNGRAVLETATAVLPCAMTEILRLHNRSIDDVKMIIPHQPSLRVLRSTADRLSVPFAKIQSNLELHANTAGATVPLLLDQLNQRKLLEPEDLVLFAAVGAGWTWGAILYQWH